VNQLFGNKNFLTEQSLQEYKISFVHVTKPHNQKFVASSSFIIQLSLSFFVFNISYRWRYYNTIYFRSLVVKIIRFGFGPISTNLVVTIVVAYSPVLQG